LISPGASLSFTAFQNRLTCTLYYDGAFGPKYSDNNGGVQLNYGF
jgi:hypothetical protein